MMAGSFRKLGSGRSCRPALLSSWLVASLLLCVAISEASAQATIFIVRHAEKADDTKDPDLSPAGRARAEALAKVLRDANITAIYATEFKRTQETAAPLAHALGIEVTIVPAAAIADLATKLKSASGNALVVGHANTIPDLIKTLGIAAPLTLADADYDNLFIVVLEEKPRLLRLHF
jgi:broad specificity phosphatase PhoE